MRRTAVLWDMDGVLADTGELHFQTWVQTLAELGIAFERQDFRQVFGMNNHSLLTIVLGRQPELDELKSITECKESAFRQQMRGRVQLLPGVCQLLGRLDAHGCRQAVASSAPQENIEALVDELGIRSYFNALVSGYDMPGKPDPGVFLEAARRLEVAPEACTVIEDSIAGVEAARRAGMFCIAVTTTNPPQALHEADVVVDSLEAVDDRMLHCLFREGEK